MDRLPLGPSRLQVLRFPTDRSEGLPPASGREAGVASGGFASRRPPRLLLPRSHGVRCLALPGRWAASSSLVPGWCLKGSSFPGPCVCPGACPLSSAEKPFPNFNFIKRPCRDSVKTGCFSQGHRGDLGKPLTLPAGWPQSSRRWLAQAWVSPETPDCKTFIR